MNKKRFRLLIFSLGLVSFMLACNLFSGNVEPTNTPLPEPTQTPVPLATPTLEPPPPTEAPTEVVEETAPELSVPEGELGTYALNWYQDNYGYWYVVGLLINNTDRAVDDIEIEISALNADGNSIYSEITYAALYNIAPGEISPFTLSLWEEIPTVETFTAEIVGQSVTDIARAEVEIRGTKMTMGNNYINVTGEIVNNGDTPIEIGNIAAATFGADGNIATANYANALISYLNPGASGPFCVSMDIPAEGAENITDFTIYTDVEVGDQEDAYSVTYLGERNYYDSDGYFHLVGELLNDSDVNLNLALIAGIYDADGNVLDASRLSMLPISSLAPGESITYDFDYWNPMNNVENIFDIADSYTVQVDLGWTWDSSTVYVDINTTDDSNEFDEFWGATFTGKVENNSGENLEGAVVIVNIYDPETGELLATGYTSLYDEIPNGETADYELTISVEDGFDISAVNYTIIAKGELP